MKFSKNLENKTPSYTYWRVQLNCKNVPAHSSLEPPLEYNQEQMPDKSRFIMTFWTVLWVTETCSFRLLL